jgi:hypothetical protein
MKKILLVTASLLLAVISQAQSFIVYAKGDYSPVTATTPATKPADPRRATFLGDVQADLGRPANFETHMTLIAAPAPAWGKKIPGAGGTIKFHDTFKGGFIVQMNLEGLTPGHTYRLCLNGNPKLVGNDLLIDAVPGLATERYYDFFTAVADDKGLYRATFGIALPPSAYELRFYVKDTADHTIFLYHDYFKFTVE